MRYSVGIKEVHTTIVDVELDEEQSKKGQIEREELAKKLALCARESEDDLYVEYSHDLSTHYWTVEEIE